MVYIIKKRTFKHSEHTDQPEEEILGVAPHINSTKELEEKMIEIAKKEGIEKKVDNFGFCNYAKCFRIGDWK